MPGEPESRTRAQRLREGITLDDTTWNQIEEVARDLQVAFD
jgi:LDH2 family malate/lactate/ureidoglycolate dehydrogenase